MRAVSSAPHDETTQAGDPPGRVRLRALIGIALAVQLFVPLTYYLRDDPYDERFAWRMFSGVRVQQCESAAYETSAGVEQSVVLHAVIQAGWVEQLRRNRRRVIERYLERRCDEEGVSSARLVNTCREVDGSVLPPREYRRDCTSGESTP